MSAFDPINVRAPQDRRRKLIARLAQQRSGGQAGALGAPGRGFRNAFRGIPKVKQTKGKDNLLHQLIQALGGGQNAPDPSEMSGGWGEAVPPPPAPVPPPPPPPPPSPDAPAETPTPEQPGAPAPAPEQQIVDTLGSTPQNTQVEQTLVQLGGGWVFDPF